MSTRLCCTVLAATLLASAAWAVENKTPTPTPSAVVSPGAVAAKDEVVPASTETKVQLQLYQCEMEKLNFMAQASECRATVLLRDEAQKQKLDLSHYRYDQAVGGFRRVPDAPPAPPAKP